MDGISLAFELLGYATLFSVAPLLYYGGIISNWWKKKKKKRKKEEEEGRQEGGGEEERRKEGVKINQEEPEKRREEKGRTSRSTSPERISVTSSVKVIFIWLHSGMGEKKLYVFLHICFIYFAVVLFKVVKV